MIKKETHKYDNGMLHIHYHVPFLKTMSMALYLKTGSCNEYTPEDWGISHFLEHMIFNGSEKYQDGSKTRKMLGSMGVFQNAWTFYSMTNYYLYSSLESMPKSMDILFDRVFKPLLKEEDIEKEKGIIQEERIMYENNHALLLEVKVSESAFAGSTYSHDIIGNKESIAEFSSEQVRKFHQTYYSPNNSVFVTYGGVKLDQISDQVNESINSLTAQDIPEHNYSDSSGSEYQKDILLKRDSESSYYSATLKSSPISSVDDLLSQMILENLLAGGNGSLLRDRFLVKDSLVSSFDFESFGLRDFSTFSFSAAMDKDKKDILKEVFFEALDYSLNEATDEEFNRAKNYAYGSLIRDIEDVGFQTTEGLSNVERLNFLNGLDLKIDDLLLGLKEATKGDSQEWWKSNINASDFKDGFLLPKK